jgi:tetratricopeptide (TPR) repeat protein
MEDRPNMSNSFLSSEEYDERAHALYNEGRYDDALDVLREGLALYPSAVELHVGVGYARLAREEFAWAKRAFDDALVLDPEHEDALAGAGELLLKFGRVDDAMRTFDKTLALGYEDDTDLMLQIGRALFREGFVEQALAFFERGVEHAADNAEAVACVGYAQHRLGHDQDAIATLRTALSLDNGFGEARVYLANLLYDVGELEAALAEFEHTTPEDHWDELGIWRLVELRKSAGAFGNDAAALQPWDDRLTEITAEPDGIDELLAEVETQFIEREAEAQARAQDHLDMLGSLLDGLAKERDHDTAADEALALDAATRPAMQASHRELTAEAAHRVVMRDGRAFDGTWDEIVVALRDAQNSTRSVDEFMAIEARRQYGATGVRISTRGPEEFLRGSEHAGVLRIIR